MTEALVTKWVDKWSAADLIYLDFSKEFDSVDLRLLLDKLTGYSIVPL